MNKSKIKKIAKLAIAVVALVGLSVGLFFILKACGLADIGKIRQWISSCGAWAWIVYILFQTVATVFLCFVPSLSADLVWLGNLLFNDNTVGGMFRTAAICLASVLLSSTIMFLIGRYGGEKLVVKLVGQEDVDKAKKLLSTKAEVFLPLMYMFPLFPDDALACCAGMTKMKLWYHSLIALVFRGIGVVTICFLGSDFFHYETFTLAEWFEFITACIVWLIVCFYIAKKLDEKIERKNKK